MVMVEPVPPCLSTCPRRGRGEWAGGGSGERRSKELRVQWVGTGKGVSGMPWLAVGTQVPGECQKTTHSVCDASLIFNEIGTLKTLLGLIL